MKWPVPPGRETDVAAKGAPFLATLQRRLFEITGVMLCTSTNMQTVNLTVASVPLSFDISTIRPEQILSWNDALHSRVVAASRFR